MEGRLSGDSLIYFPKFPGNLLGRTSEELAYDGTIGNDVTSILSHIADQLLNQNPVSVSHKEKVESYNMKIPIWNS